MNQCDVVLRNPVRTAIGTAGSSLKVVAASDLVAPAIRDTLKRSWLAIRLMYSMRRDGLKRGVVTHGIGGWQGVALALESI